MWAANPNAGLHEYAFSAGLGAGFGGLLPVGGFADLGGSLLGGGIEASAGGEFFGNGLQFGGLVGSIAGGSLQNGWRAVAWQGGGAAVGGGVGYGYGGDASSALIGANLGSLGGGIGQGGYQALRGGIAPSSASVSRGAQLRAKLGTQFDEYARFRNQGFSPAQSKYLTQPYENGLRSGHHYPITQSKGRGVLPDAIVDSRFNVLKPKNINLGRFYELHYRVDPEFHGAPFPRAIGGSWRGNQLGLQKYHGLQRIWYATPSPLKAARGAAAGISGASAYWWISSTDAE